MNILIATNSLDIGGAETHIVDLSRELARRGHDVTVVSNGGAYVATIVEAGVRHIKAPLHTRNPLAMLRSYIILRQTVDKYHTDVFHAHARIPAYLGSLIKKHRPELRFVTTVHGAFRVTPTYRRFTRWGEAALAVSEDLVSYLADNYGVPRSQIKLTVNGIDTEWFIPCRGVDRNRVVHISRLEPDTVRCAENLIAVMPRLRAEFPGISLIIAGDGSRLRYISRLADALNAKYPGAVTVCGARTDVAELLRQGGIFAGVSRAALEAMSCRLPVILYGDAGYMGVFTEDKAEAAAANNFTCRGNNFPADEQEALKNDITALLKSTDETLTAMGEYNRELIKRRYSVGKMCDDAMALYLNSCQLSVVSCQ